MGKNVMEMSRKQKWLGWLSKILIVAIVITAIPFYENEALMVSAATDPDMNKATSFDVETIDDFMKHWNDYANAVMSGESGYEGGIVLQIKQSLDFSEAEVITNLPSSKIWINTGGNDLTNVWYGMFDMGSSDGIMPETGEYANYLNISGGGSIHWNNYDEASGAELVSEWLLNAGAKLVISDVEMDTTKFIAYEGSSVIVDGQDYSNPINSGFIQYHSAKEATYRYYNNIPTITIDGDEGDTTSIIHFQKIAESWFQTDNGLLTECDVLNMVPSDVKDFSSGRYIYEKDALPACITKLKYDEYSYNVPDEAFRVDNEYGIYSLSADGKEMTIHGCGPADFVRMSFEAYSQTETRLRVYSNFTPYIIGESEDMNYNAAITVSTKKVTFNEYSIPDNFYYYGGTDTATLVPVTSVYITNSVPYDIDFTFLFETKYDTTGNPRELEIFNRSGASVTAPGGENIWVLFQSYASGFNLTVDSPDNLTVDELVETDLSGCTTKYDLVDPVEYLLAGSTVILSPKVSDYSIYDINLGYWQTDENGYYLCDTGRNAYDNITFYTNGSRMFTVPNFSCDFLATVGVMGSSRIMNGDENGNDTSIEYSFSTERVHRESYNNPENSTEVIYEDWYDTDVTITGVETEEVSTEGYAYHFEICEEAEGVYTAENKEWPTDGVTISEEGRSITKTYKMINLTKQMITDYNDLDLDGNVDEQIFVPAAGYGGESWITYTYTLDKTLPRITEVRATDSNGNQLELEGGGWYDGSTTIPTAVTVWTNLSPITLTVQGTGEENGTGITGYSFREIPSQNDEWINKDYKEYTADGKYALEIYVRDQMSEYTGKSLDNKWITTFGIDTVAPVIHYTDAVSATGEELQTGATYQGNLYLEVVEEISGFYDVRLYTKVNNAWIEDANALKPAETSATTGYFRYYISPTDTDKVYRIVVSDMAGNETTYEEITLKGYEQDIEVSLETPEVVYGNSGQVAVKIKNVSNSNLSIQQLKLREGMSDEALRLQTIDFTELLAGEEVQIEVLVLDGIDAGEYETFLDIVYTNESNNMHLAMDKTYSQQIIAKVAKAQGTATFDITDCYYGETLNPVYHSTTNGIEGVTILYKDKNDLSAQYTDEMPTAVGSYQAKAEFPENNNYNKVIIETSFNISRLEAAGDMYTMTAPPEENEWYTTDVTITATNDNLLSITENGTYTNRLVIENSIETYRFYIKTSTGAITEAVELADIKIDKTAPTIGENEGIYVVENWWQEFLETITFGVYQKETQTVQIKAHDDESGMHSISYYVSEAALTLDEVKSLQQWVEGNEFVMDVSVPQKYIVYARLENKAGLVTYISTDGIVIEATTIGTEGSVYLEAGKSYELGEGNWSVEGDDTVYVGGNLFYVVESGDYDFKVVE